MGHPSFVCMLFALEETRRMWRMWPGPLRTCNGRAPKSFCKSWRIMPLKNSRTSAPGSSFCLLRARSPGLGLLILPGCGGVGALNIKVCCSIWSMGIQCFRKMKLSRNQAISNENRFWEQTCFLWPPQTEQIPTIMRSQDAKIMCGSWVMAM